MFAVLPVWPAWLACVAAGLYLILFKESFDPRATVFWISILFALPVAGLFVYMYCGCTVRSRAVGRAKASREAAAMEARSEEPDSADAALSGLLSSYGADAYTSCNSAALHWTAQEGIDALVSAISGATRSVFIEARRLMSGATGRGIADMICSKAAEGVDVRILTSSLGFLRTPGLRRMSRAGARHATFRPRPVAALSLRTFDRNLRDIVVVDGERAYLGPDTFVEFRGRAASRLEARFLADWAHAVRGPIERPCGSVQNCGDVRIQLVPSGPDCPGNALLHGLSSVVSGAKETLLLGLPFMIPGDEMYGAIRQVALGGTDVTVLLPADCRHWYQKWNSLAAVSPLADIGVNVFFSGRSLKRCVAVADRRVCIMGSGAFNSRSTSMDYCLSAAVYSDEFAGEVADSFIRETEEACRITADDYRRRSFADRLRIAVSRMLMFLNRRFLLSRYLYK